VEAKNSASTHMQRIVTDYHGYKGGDKFFYEKNRYVNHMDEAYGLISMSMSPELMFHIEACTRPNEIWTKLEDLFGKKVEKRGHMLEVEMNSLDLRNFDKIQELIV
jgi:hypothetical protein